MSEQEANKSRGERDREIEKKAQDALKAKYKEKGMQQMSLDEYTALKAKESKRRKAWQRFRLPAPLKFLLSTPFLIIFCFGLFFIPWIIYLIATSKPADEGAKKGAKTVVASGKNTTRPSTGRR